MARAGDVVAASPPSAPTRDGLVIRGASKAFTRRRRPVVQALEGVDLVVEPGEFVSLIGPSGCGKSTLLRAIGGLVDLDRGSIEIGGRTPATARRSKDFGFVPQVPALLPWRTVHRNVHLLQELNPRGADHRSMTSDEVAELLERVGLSDFLDALPGQLSGGMQQRVALVRAFALGAPVLLMDEPFSALDEITRADMRYLLLDLWQRVGTTVVFVTHSIPEAVVLADRIVVLAPRPGRVIGEVRNPLDRPRHEDVEDSEPFHAAVADVRALLRRGMAT